jgi:hypothetical protein
MILLLFVSLFAIADDAKETKEITKKNMALDLTKDLNKALDAAIKRTAKQTISDGTIANKQQNFIQEESNKRFKWGCDICTNHIMALFKNDLDKADKEYQESLKGTVSDEEKQEKYLTYGYLMMKYHAALNAALSPAMSSQLCGFPADLKNKTQMQEAEAEMQKKIKTYLFMTKEELKDFKKDFKENQRLLDHMKRLEDEALKETEKRISS